MYMIGGSTNFRERRKREREKARSQATDRKRGEHAHAKLLTHNSALQVLTLFCQFSLLHFFSVFQQLIIKQNPHRFSVQKDSNSLILTPRSHRSLQTLVNTEIQLFDEYCFLPMATQSVYKGGRERERDLLSFVLF